MSREYKFQLLLDYLLDSNKDEVELSFEEIEKMLGFRLSESAYKYDQYWRSSPTHTITKAWENSGYTIINIDIKNQKLHLAKLNVERKSNSSERGVIFPTFPKANQLPDDTIVHLSEAGLRYYDEVKKDSNARYLSWEHCYKTFIYYKGKIVNREEVDFLSLHLAFYLASWGMYRGSSFLLQKDYKIHYDTILEIFKPEYEPLWSIKCQEYRNNENLKLLDQLCKNIRDIYICHRANIDGRNDVSDTLLTKILMGTLGCVPAYDRYFVNGISKNKVASAVFSMNSIVELALFYENNLNVLETVRSSVSCEYIEYPQMKILDMCFWQIGYELDNAKR